MHIKKVSLHPELFPTTEYYPFNLPIFHRTKDVDLTSPITFFVGENGAGKSTLLRSISYKCGIYIWRGVERTRYDNNPYEDYLYRAIKIEWANGHVQGAFFGSQHFQNFAQLIDEWAASDPKMLEYYGGKSLMTKSHGQSIITYFRNRYKIKGLYLMDEPETALSPQSQLDLLKIIIESSRRGNAQFIIATHSPILLACPEAQIYSFDKIPVQPIGYEDTEYYRFYKDFLNNPESYLSGIA